LPSQNSEEHKLNSSACVADLQELCAEFQRAIAALATDDLAAIETSTEVQESLIEKLQEWCREESLRGHSLDKSSTIKIPAQDFKALVSLTQVYSSLLQRAMRTARLRASLCRTYRQNFPSAPEPAATGWSCEA
jgi:hypothetical protein